MIDNAGNAAKFDLRYPAKSATPYRCTTEGCLNYTSGHYCTIHSDRCDECGDEWERGTLQDASRFRGPGRGLWCDYCVRMACNADNGGTSVDCYCGFHVRLMAAYAAKGVR